MIWRSPHRIIVEIYLCIGGYYARLICSVPPAVQGFYPGVGYYPPTYLVCLHNGNDTP